MVRTEAAEVDARNLDVAGATWANLPENLKQNLLAAVRLLTPTSGAENDLRHSLDQSQPTAVDGD